MLSSVEPPHVAICLHEHCLTCAISLSLMRCQVYVSSHLETPGMDCLHNLAYFMILQSSSGLHRQGSSEL